MYIHARAQQPQEEAPQILRREIRHSHGKRATIWCRLLQTVTRCRRRQTTHCHLPLAPTRRCRQRQRATTCCAESYCQKSLLQMHACACVFVCACVLERESERVCVCVCVCVCACVCVYAFEERQRVHRAVLPNQPTLRASMCVCLCVCKRNKESERKRQRESERERENACGCMCLCVCVCVYLCVCMCA